jgi:uncharacterized protein YdcH (DUF465 family)
VLRLEKALDVESQKVELLGDQNARLTEMLSNREARDSDRFDRLLAKHDEILDNRLGLGEQPTKREAGAVRPLGRSVPWGRQAATFERKRREAAEDADKKQAHWVKKVDDIETLDSQVSDALRDDRGVPGSGDAIPRAVSDVQTGVGPAAGSGSGKSGG